MQDDTVYKISRMRLNSANRVTEKAKNNETMGAAPSSPVWMRHSNSQCVQRSCLLLRVNPGFQNSPTVQSSSWKRGVCTVIDQCGSIPMNGISRRIVSFQCHMARSSSQRSISLLYTVVSMLTRRSSPRRGGCRRHHNEASRWCYPNS